VRWKRWEVHVLCAESLRVQAYFDGEVDAITASQIERHTGSCAECRELLQELEQLRAAIRQEVAYERAPPELVGRISRALDRESVANVPKQSRVDQMRGRGRSFWAGALGGMSGAIVAGTLAFFLLAPQLTRPLQDALVAAHVRSLMPSHLIDVVSTDRHTVKPWFGGHTDVSPVVADFAQQGYRLIGGRADYIARQRAAVVVYQHGAHVINVFTWAGDQRTAPGNVTRNGYHLAFWKSGDLLYCAVSDAGWDEMLALQGLLEETAKAAE